MHEPDPATPLWRAAQVFRLLSCIYALGFQIAINQDLDHPAIGWLLFAVLIGWSVGLRGRLSAGVRPTARVGAGRNRCGGGADAVHRVRRVRPVGAGQPVMADDVVGDQRDDLGGDPDGSDPRHAHRCGGDDRQHGGQGFHQLRPWPQRHDRHRARGGSRGGDGRTNRAARPRRTGTGDAACGVAGGTGAVVAPGARRRHPGARAGVPPRARNRRRDSGIGRAGG